MKHLKDKLNTVAFLNAVSRCQGEVFFETAEGDVLNLKSMLTRYLFAAVAEKKEIISTGSIRFTQEEDDTILADYLQA